MKSIIEKYNLQNMLRPLKPGDIVEGTVIGGARLRMYLDLGPQGTGVVLGKEFLLAREMIKKLKKGDKVFAKVIEPQNEEGYVELSLQSAGKELAWEQLRKKKENNELLRVKILGANKGGLITEVLGIQAFIPSSQLATEHYPRVENAEPAQIVRQLQKLIGKELEVYILDLDPKTDKLILSEKLKEMERIRELISAFEVGEVVEGEVTGIADFGIFIAFPFKTEPPEKIEGLCHISELSWETVEHPKDIVKVGQKVKAKIIKIDEDRVFLSLRALTKDPWEGAEEKYKPGTQVKGKITKLTPFGALVEIEPGLQAICHISQFGTKRKMEEKLKVGGEYNFIVLETNSKERKMDLKMA